MRILQRNLKRTYCVRNVTTTNVPLFKFRCNIFIGFRIIKEMPGSVASGTPCITCCSIVVFQHSPRARCSKTRQEADSTIMRKLKRLFVKGYSWRSPILPWRDFTKSCQDGTNISICCGVMLKNGGTSVDQINYTYCSYDVSCNLYVVGKCTHCLSTKPKYI
jgi:hypothetical protein